MILTAFRSTGLLKKKQFRWLFLMIAASPMVLAAVAEGEEPNQATNVRRTNSREILTDREWQEVEAAVDRGLAFLIRQQLADGAFHNDPENEPGISGLCVMSFLSRGHLPGQGPYGDKLARSVSYLLDCQQSDGLISRQRQPYHAPYNHGISSLVISELYGMSQTVDEGRYRKVIERALEFTSHRYSQPKLFRDDEGAWRYLKRHHSSDGDLSVTSWNVMFLRSAKNSGFDVEISLIDEALAYMKRLYDPQFKTFRYEIHADDPQYNHPRGMAGAGALSLSLAGEHDSEVAQNAAKYILKRPFDQYDRPAAGEEYPCYASFYCSQGMFHMGGEYWDEFYPQLVRTLLKAQRPDGSWFMKQGNDVRYGTAYMTALTVLALTPPYQMLPIFQR